MGWQIEEIFAEADTKDSLTCSFFWLLVKTLKLFWERNSKFPLNGSIPDMTSLTEYYLEL